MWRHHSWFLHSFCSKELERTTDSSIFRRRGSWNHTSLFCLSCVFLFEEKLHSLPESVVSSTFLRETPSKSFLDTFLFAFLILAQESRDAQESYTLSSSLALISSSLSLWSTWTILTCREWWPTRRASISKKSWSPARDFFISIFLSLATMIPTSSTIGSQASLQDC